MGLTWGWRWGWRWGWTWGWTWGWRWGWAWGWASPNPNLNTLNVIKNIYFYLKYYLNKKNIFNKKLIYFYIKIINLHIFFTIIYYFIYILI